MKSLSLILATLLSVSAFPQFFSSQWVAPWENPLLQDREAFLTSKDQVRQLIMSRSLEQWDKSEPASNDNVISFLQARPSFNTLEALEENQLTKGRVAVQPWSDDYWPIYSGILGKRYSDPYFAYKDSWIDFFDYVQEQPASSIWASEDEVAKKSLGPSEKYDRLIGDEKGTLTQEMWAEGKAYWESYNDVESWMGICHGWAIAAFMHERPQKTLELKSPSGEAITFYPSDIKALSSLLWANARTQTLFVGGRCNTSNPEEDDNGRIIDQDCFDSNPATWHLAMTELVGVRKESFVFDATYDYQVWNQPVVSYEYRYFNPKTMDDGLSLEKAKVAISEMEKDRYKKYRSPKAKYVVGIEMQVDYVVETEPTSRDHDDESWDSVTSAYYMYDLELDAKGRIIGGEWYQSYHPDFMWRPKSNQMARSYFEYGLNSNAWKEGQPLPKQWRSRAKQSAQYKMPLGVIVEKMIQKTK